MHEVATSRRAVMCALAILPTIAAMPVDAQAMSLACMPISDSEWLSLLSVERHTSDALDIMAENLEAADERFYVACKSFEDDWQKRSDARKWFGVPAIEGESAEDQEARVQANIRIWNADGEELREERDGYRKRIRVETGLAEVEKKHAAACDTHSAAIKAIVAYPSRDPDIIAHKLKLILDRYGDDNGDLGPLLASIGGVA